MCDSCGSVTPIVGLTGERIEVRVPDDETPPGVGRTISQWVIICDACGAPEAFRSFEKRRGEMILTLYRAGKIIFEEPG
jgi:hypothetical protein